MSDPLSNLEIQDVLSSIRRLVSEDRQSRQDRAPDKPDAPSAGKLILTEAHRVEDDSDAIALEALDASADDRMPEAENAGLAADPLIGEAAQDADWTAAVSGMPADSGKLDGIRPASVLEEDIASLESTIAELEAAVADIADFEPDGSEVKSIADDPDKRTLEDAFDNGFAVDTGGRGIFDPEDLSIEQPVTGDVLTPRAPEKSSAQALPGEFAEDDGSDLNDVSEDPPVRDAIAFIRREATPRRADWQVISGSENPAPASDALTGRLHLGQLSRIDAADDAGDVAEEGGIAEAAAEAAETPGEVTSEAESVERDSFEGDDLRGGMFEAVEPDADETNVAPEAMAAPRANSEALRDPTDGQPGDIPVETDEPLETVGAVYGADSEPLEEGEDDLGLFDAGDEAVIDMDMLRDLIAEVIREELQGPLGERITRNVRKLVRQEIARAFEAQKFD